MTQQWRRAWDGAEWQNFARRLVQTRHGPQNVQDVPDRVKGDAGIEFFTTDGCCYQCYAPEQSSDTSKAASAMKHKASRDLRKLIKNQEVVRRMLGSIRVSRWILLCPFLDDKAVIAHVRTKAGQLGIHDLDYVDCNFSALVQSQIDFENELMQLRSRSLGLPIDVQPPSTRAMEVAIAQYSTHLDQKIRRGFPDSTATERARRRNKFMLEHLRCANALDQLKQEYPDLWELYRRTIRTEEARLESIGSSSDEPRQQLNGELSRLESLLPNILPSLDQPAVKEIALGTLATWLVECPLDFE